MDNRLSDYFKEVSKDLILFERDKSPVIIPSNFKEVNWKYLTGHPLITKSLIDCYKDVFGRSDIWGEGFICPKCKKIFPIDSVALNCEDCNEPLIDFYPQEEFKKKLKRELDSDSSFCTLMLNHHNNQEVAGFCWGEIAKIGKLRRRLYNSDHTKDSADQIIENIIKLNNISKIIFFEELGIKKEWRGELFYLAILTRSAFETGYNQGAESVIFWTAKESPIYQLSHAFGFVNLMETSKGIIILYLEDFIPLLKILQNKSSDEIIEIIVRGHNLE